MICMHFFSTLYCGLRLLHLLGEEASMNDILTHMEKGLEVVSVASTVIPASGSLTSVDGGAFLVPRDP